MSVSPTSNSGSFSLPTSSQQPAFDPSTPAPPYAPMAAPDELSLSSQPSGSLPPYSSLPGSSSPPIPSSIGSSGAKPGGGMGIGGLLLAGVAGIPGYFAGKNLLKSHPVVGGVIGGIAAAVAGLIGWGYISQKSAGK